MRCRFLALLLFAVCPVLSFAQADAKKDDKAKAVLVEKPPEMVTIYLHYFFPNYCHGYYIGYTITVPCQVPVAHAKYYIQNGQASEPAPNYISTPR